MQNSHVTPLPKPEKQFDLRGTYQILKHRQVAIFIRCFLYPDVLRCGAVYLGPGMPNRLQLYDHKDNAIALIKIPERYTGLADIVLLGDGHVPGFNRWPELAEFDLVVQ